MEKDKIIVHYHVEIITKEESMELVVAEQKGKYIVEDWWGDVTGTSNILGRLDNVKDAVKFAVMILKKKYKGYIVRGAGCPPEKMLDEVEKELKNELKVE